MTTTIHSRFFFPMFDLPGPSVDSVSLDKGANPDGGDKVEITGFNFGLPGSPKASTAVGFIDELPCVSTVVKSDTLLVCTTPPNGNSGGDMVVRETFDTFVTDNFKAGAKQKGASPLFLDVGGSTGGIAVSLLFQYFTVFYSIFHLCTNTFVLFK